MEFRFVKDLAIALIVIILGAFALKLSIIYNKTTDKKVPKNSIYNELSVSDTLMQKIRMIESSIQDRKMFTFTITRDPLKQDVVVKGKEDIEQEYEDMVKNMFRLASTSISQSGRKLAVIEYQDNKYYAEVGDIISGRRIVEIGSGYIKYNINGAVIVATAQPIPPKPVDIETPGVKTDVNY